MEAAQHAQRAQQAAGGGSGGSPQQAAVAAGGADGSGAGAAAPPPTQQPSSLVLFEERLRCALVMVDVEIPLVALSDGVHSRCAWNLWWEKQPHPTPLFLVVRAWGRAVGWWLGPVVVGSGVFLVAGECVDGS